MFFLHPNLRYLISCDSFVKFFASEPVIFQDESSAEYCIPPAQQATRLGYPSLFYAP
jgi:hypothetical protein